MPSSATQKIAKIIGPGTDNLSLGLELKLTPNYLLYAKPHLDNRIIKDHIGFARLPESYNKYYSGDIVMTKINPGFTNPLEYIVTFQVDEPQGLMVILTIQEPTNQVKVRCLTFEKHSRRHPQSSSSKTIIPFQDTLIDYQLQIYGDLVGVLLSGHHTSCLFILGWTQGSPYGLLAHNLPAGAMTSFSFLNRDKLLTTNLSSRCIDFWRFYPGVIEPSASIALPSIARGIILENFVCTPLTGKQLVITTCQEWFALFMTFTLTMLVDGCTYAVADLVLQKERLDWLSNYGPQTWRSWGGERIAWFDESDTKDSCNVAGGQHVSLGSPHAYGKPSTITVHIFNPFGFVTQPSHISVDGVSPFTERLVENLDTCTIFEGQLHCDRVIVPDRRIFAIHDSPNKTIIMLYVF